MKIYIVSEQHYEDYSQHGVFSTQHAAETYIQMVYEAEKQVRRSKHDKQTVLDIEEYEVDEHVNLMPIFVARGMHRGYRELKVVYREQLPETQVYPAYDNGPAYAVETYGFTPAEAKEKLRAVRQELLGS